MSSTSVISAARACRMLRHLSLAAVMLAAQTAAAQPSGQFATPRQLTDKSRFTLFDPTPPELMREIAPDRPDTTESPYTVDAGHVQLEFSFAEWRKGGDAEELSLMPSNIKIGLTNNADLQFVLDPFLRGQSTSGIDQGHGDSQIRLKLNLWGNDGGGGFFGETALAVMPFLQFPTGADAFSNDDELEGGVIVPFSIPLPSEFGLTVMAEIDFVRDGSGGYDSLFIHSGSLGRQIAGPLSGYIEYVGIHPIDGDGDYQALLGGGLVYAVSEELLLDTGVEVGLTSDADDLRLFVGMTLRL